MSAGHPEVVGLQVGVPRDIETASGTVTTGYFKQPADQVVIDSDGICGDFIADKDHHGGPCQAVYLYAQDHYQWWTERFGLALEPAAFGENITLSSFGEAVPRVGDRWSVGGVTLEVSSCRIPCDTLTAAISRAAQGDRDDWAKRFRDSLRPGVYARVITGGTVAVGAAAKVKPAASPNVSVLEVLDLFYAIRADPPPRGLVQRVERALDSPLAQRVDLLFRSWLGKEND